MPPAIARVLLSAVMTDTVILKSPTATPTDHEQVAYLAGIAGVDPTEFGLAVFKCRGGEDDMPVDKLVAPTPRSSRSATPPFSSRSTRRWIFPPS